MNYEDLHHALMKELFERIKSGTATSGDLSVARQFLKDNNIETTKDNPEAMNLETLLEGLPKLDD